MKALLTSVVFILLLTSTLSAAPAPKTPVQTHSKEINFEKGAVIFREGQRADGFYRLLKGEVAVLKMIGEKNMLIAKIGPGEIFGEMAIVDDSPRSATIQATEKSTVHFITSEEFEKQIKTLDPWAAELIETLSRRLRDTTSELATKLD